MRDRDAESNDFTITSLSAWPVDTLIGQRVRVAVDKPPATDAVAALKNTYLGVVGIVTDVTSAGIISVQLYDPNANKDIEWAFRACDLELIS